MLLGYRKGYKQVFTKAIWNGWDFSRPTAWRGHQTSTKTKRCLRGRWLSCESVCPGKEQGKWNFQASKTQKTNQPKEIPKSLIEKLKTKGTPLKCPR